MILFCFPRQQDSFLFPLIRQGTSKNDGKNDKNSTEFDVSPVCPMSENAAKPENLIMVYYAEDGKVIQSTFDISNLTFIPNYCCLKVNFVISYSDNLSHLYKVIRDLNLSSR